MLAQSSYRQRRFMRLHVFLRHGVSWYGHERAPHTRALTRPLTLIIKQSTIRRVASPLEEWENAKDLTLLRRFHLPCFLLRPNLPYELMNKLAAGELKSDSHFLPVFVFEWRSSYRFAWSRQPLSSTSDSKWRETCLRNSPFGKSHKPTNWVIVSPHPESATEFQSAKHFLGHSWAKLPTFSRDIEATRGQLRWWKPFGKENAVSRHANLFFDISLTQPDASGDVCSSEYSTRTAQWSGLAAEHPPRALSEDSQFAMLIPFASRAGDSQQRN